VGAGVDEAWVREPPGIRVHGLATHFGTLHLTMCADADGGVRVRLGGEVRPPGGIVLMSPYARPLREVEIAGSLGPSEDSRWVRVHDVPAEVVLRY
jgi:hypothetical protein